MFKRLSHVGLIALSCFIVTGAWVPAVSAASSSLTNATDDVLASMRQELERNVKSLRIEDYKGPYFLAYQLKDVQSASISARHGALYDGAENRRRLARVEVRVGDYELDSSEDDEGQSYKEMIHYQAPSDLPVEGGLDALREALWLLTDQAYKQALTAYHRVRGAWVYKTSENEHKGSFTQEKSTSHRDEVNAFVFDEDRWKETARRLSWLASQPEPVFDSAVEIEARKVTRYLVNSEGSEVVTDQVIYAVHVQAYARADDGMLLDHSVDYYGRTEGDLPSLEVLEAAVGRMLKELLALREAELLPPYTGPAILRPRATGVFFHEAIGHRLEGHRQNNNEEGQTFSERVGSAILPRSISVYDDPQQRAHGDTRLNGHYLIDDEGVAAQHVVLVDKGVLKGFLMRRRPTGDFKASNGHGRAQGILSPVPRMGSLFVETEQGLSAGALKQRLLDEVRSQGKPFGLIVGDITGGSTNTMSYGYQAFKGNARMVYRVDAETGEETLVRGVEIVGTPLSSINKIIAMGNEPDVFNGFCGAESGYVAVSTIAPAALFSEIELQRSARTSQRGPILSRPPR